MPSIQTIVDDLNNGSVVGIGAKPASNVTSLESTISGTCRVKNLFVHMKASITTPSNRLSCVAAATDPSFNGVYIHFDDDWTTAGILDVNRRLAVSGNFSGCLYKIYRSAGAVFTCVHIHRPAGADADALVRLMDTYARQKGWAELQAVPTTGLIGVGGCTEVMVVSQLFFNQRIDTIRLAINNRGLVVGRTLYSTQI